MARWLKSLTSKNVSLITVGMNLDRVAELFNVGKLSSWLSEDRWFYTSIPVILLGWSPVGFLHPPFKAGYSL